MDYSIIEKVRVPIIIPRRGRGHSEVLATIGVHVDSDAPYICLSDLYALGHHTVNLRECEKLTQNILHQYANALTQLNVQFSLPIERVGESLQTGYIGMEAGYVVVAKKKGMYSMLCVEVFVPIYYSLAKLTVFVPSDKTTFEDVYDTIHRSLQFVTHTGVTEQTTRPVGLTASDAMQTLKAQFKHQGVSFGRFVVSIAGPTSTYDVRYISQWGKEISNFIFL